MIIFGSTDGIKGITKPLIIDIIFYIDIILAMLKTCVIGLLGPNLDSPDGPTRWGQWRPTVSICQHEERLIDRFDLLYQSKFQKLADRVAVDIQSVSPETQVVHHHIEFDDAWDFEQVFASLYDFASDYPFDTEQFDYQIHITTGTHVAQICLFLLTESRHMPGQLLQTAPPCRKNADKAGEYRTIDLDLARYDQIAKRFNLEQSQSLAFLKSGIATRDAAFNRTIEQIEHVAVHGRDPILLTGPTGAGKSQLARRIYELKKLRRQVSGPLVEINCATLRGDTAMSSLFGHTKGAFTGAAAARKGLLAEADTGLLFLDEVGELGIDEQTMLLKAVEEKRFLPMGCDHEVSSDFQLICGTNRDLHHQVQQGHFREDLLARINLWPFQLPGLADRRDDIEPNLDYELNQLEQMSGRRVRFNKEARQRYLSFAVSPTATWAGNFRDLNASVRRMATMAAAGRIASQVVEDEIARLEQNWGTAAASDEQSVLRDLLGEHALAEIDPFDRIQLTGVVHVCRRCNSLSEAGRELFSASRQKKKSANDSDRLRKYLGRFKLTWQRIHSTDRALIH